MKDVRSLLEGADPLRRESGLSAEDAARMRHAIMSLPQGGQAPRIFWPRAVAVTAVVVLMVVVVTVASLRRPANVPLPVEKAVADPAGASERLQLQFATPGGTRIIWTLDPEFKVGGVAP